MDGCRCAVSSIADVFEENGVEWGAGELEQRLGDLGATGFYGDIVVFFKIDAGPLDRCRVGLAVQLFFKARIAGTRDVTAVAPGTRAVVAGR